MRPLKAGRRKAGRRHRLVPGLLLTVVVNLSVQPCAMALGSGHDCARCPPAHEQPTAGHHGSAVAVDEALCASSPGACEVSGVRVDGRGAQLKFKNSIDLPVAMPNDPGTPLVRRPIRCRTVVDPPEPAGPTPPLHVLFCVYLK